MSRGRIKMSRVLIAYFKRKLASKVAVVVAVVVVVAAILTSFA